MPIYAFSLISNINSFQSKDTEKQFNEFLLIHLHGIWRSPVLKESMLLKTKGDNNKNEDCYLTNKNQFLGIVYKGFENTDLGKRV